ncbi:protein phosphatase 1 regulatory subunit 12A-like isoform X3 [Photinus pyralis]|uniref:protein phosphatase 1 regulatory subunit 12A-like isoform X3 n=1 Tax=Photinus pyralis TaxID=7054 RepID=UPI0012673124|nr:protein phosphatase 1 regulatory subunit 12A-like isoform X3 [Photinus pyralis]
MSIETRSSSALFKRAEQLKRWEESDTNRESITPKQKPKKVKFSSGCVFLAACAAGDKEEVLRLIEKGADIDTANVDGLTALHQACIDDNLDMVEFLVEHGSEVNRGDNEGWTPLHATASCGFLSIAKYLIEHGANVAAVNNDGELPLDIAECEDMEDLLQSEIDEQGVDCDAARSEEERQMFGDAKEWLANNSNLVDSIHPKTGATALHVASAKGYVKVIKLILQCGADVDKQDVDGWTPLHAAAHWGQKESAKILTEHFADMDSKNYVGQTAFDVADTDMFQYLEDLQKNQNKEEVLNRRQAKKRSEISAEPETPTKLKRIEVEIEEKEKDILEIGGMDVSSESETESDTSSSDTESNSVNSTDEDKKNRVNSLTNNEVITNNDEEAVKISVNTAAPTIPPKPLADNNSDDNLPTWRRPVTRQTKVDPIKTSSFRDRSSTGENAANNENEVLLTRTNSFQNDPVFYTKYQALRARIRASSLSQNNSQSLRSQSPYIIAPSNNVGRQSRSVGKENTIDHTTVSSTPSSVTTSSSNSPTPTSPLPGNQPVRSGLKLTLGATTLLPTNSVATPSTPTTPGGTRLAVIKNFFKSFVPPVRDEESETQRKAHAKRVRETRRSTQGVTLEEIKSAEQLVKKKNQTGVNNNNNNTNNNEQADSSNGVSVTATITTAAPTVPTRDNEESASVYERRPSWRLRVDNGVKFKLEDATKEEELPSTPSFLRRPSPVTNPPLRPVSNPVECAEATITIPLRRPKSQDNKEQDKENDARNAQATLATQAAIQRRRRPKRRSTGVVAFDNLDDLDSEKDQGTGGGDFDDSAKQNHDESGTDRSNRSSRLGSTTDIRGENGEIDYKKLYEQAILENDRLRDKLKKSDEELRDTKQTLERLNTVTSKNSLSELEKREKRAMERKLSEMEEELKQLEILKSENQRLKDENGALIRVISKLSK